MNTQFTLLPTALSPTPTSSSWLSKNILALTLLLLLSSYSSSSFARGIYALGGGYNEWNTESLTEYEMKTRGFDLIAGYRFNPYFAIEGGQKSSNSNSDMISTTKEQTYTYFAPVGFFPFHRNWEAFARMALGKQSYQYQFCEKEWALCQLKDDFAHIHFGTGVQFVTQLGLMSRLSFEAGSGFSVGAYIGYHF